MTDFNIAYTKYRVEKSREAYSDAVALADLGSWNAAMNRLYYSAYYMISALLVANKIETKTHSGVRIQFNLLFIKTSTLPKELGQLYSDLFDSRQKGDYGDMYDFDQETIMGLLDPVQDLLNKVETLIKNI